jgi:hypothetical protein
MPPATDASSKYSSRRAFEEFLAGKAAKHNERLPQELRIDDKAEMSQRVEHVARWFLRDFSILDIAEEMEDQGISLRWTLDILKAIADDPKAGAGARVDAVGRLREIRALGASMSELVGGGSSGKATSGQDAGEDATVSDPALRVCMPEPSEKVG